jgi:hypothetical protein
MTIYRLNWDALLARVVYRWHWRVALGTLLLAGLGGVAAGLVPPVWLGESNLTIHAPPGAVVLVDGRPWPRQLYAGAHTVSAELPDGRRSWAEITLRSGEMITVDLPAGQPAPHVRPLPPAAPGMQVAHIWHADGAWRVVSRPEPVASAETETGGAEPTATPQPGQTLAFGPRGAERLGTIDAYAGLADQLRADGRSIVAVYHPGETGFGQASAGRVEVRGWATGGTIPLSGTATLLRLSPDGQSLLIAEQTPAGGEQLLLARHGQPREPVVGVPGSVRRVSWHPEGRAVVVHSQEGDRLALTLARLEPSIAAVTIAELDAASYAGAIVPITWDDSGLLWVAPNQAHVPTLWAAPLDALIPEERGPLEALAIDYRPDGSLQVATTQGDRLAIGHYRGTLLIHEAVVTGVAPTDDMHGVWHGHELLIHGSRGAWLVTPAQQREEDQ